MALIKAKYRGLDSAAHNLVLLSSVTASNDASVTFDNTIITDTYDTYKVIGENIKFATDDVRAEFHLSTDNGSNYTTSGYHHTAFSSATSDANDGSTYRSSTSTTGMKVIGIKYNQGNATNEKTNFEVNFHSLRDTASYKFMSLRSAYTNNSGNIASDTGVYGLKSITSAVNNIKFSASSGNITSGKFTIFGIKN